MGNLLLEYMQKRLEKESISKTVTPGPIITISREFGCPSQELAQKLLHRLSRKEHEWEYLSKEILDKAARELKIPTFELESALNYKVAAAAQDMLSFMTSKYYPREKKVKATYAEVISDLANNGNVIIMGRASAMITKNIKDALHIKLRAPLSWRVNAYCDQNKDTPFEEAKKLVVDMDKQRASFRESFQNGVPENDFYDLTFNCESFSVDEIAGHIIKACKGKELI